MGNLRSLVGFLFVLAVCLSAVAFHSFLGPADGPPGQAMAPFLIVFLIFVGLSGYLFSWVHAALMFVGAILISQLVLAPAIPVLDPTRGPQQASRLVLYCIVNVFAIWGIHRLKSQAEIGKVLQESLNEIYIFDAKTWRFVEVNRGARENLGYTMQELRQMTPLHLQTDFSHESFEQTLKRVDNGSGEKTVVETRHLRKDGSEYPVEVHLHALKFRSAPAYLAIAVEASARGGRRS